MKFSLTNRLYTGFAAAILLVFLIGILSYQTFQRQSEAGNWVKHTYQVLNKAEMIEKLLVDMETGHIGYRSTGLKQFLKPYNDALLNIKPVINDLKSLTADNPPQVERVNRIAANIETLLLFWHQQADNKLGRYDQEAFIDLITREKEFTEDIRNELDQVIHTEQVLLKQREKENNESIREATYELILGTVLTLIIVLTLIYFTIKEFNSHRRAEATLQVNYRELEHLNQISTEKNWLLTGISLINNNLQDINDLTSLTQSILKTITRYLDLPASAFYCYNERAEELQLNASVALPSLQRTAYAVGEGVVGYAATERSLTIVSDVPADYWAIQSASGQARPGQVVCLPLWYNKDLKGVMEFASFQPIGEQALLLLRSVANNIAVAINAADSHDKVMTLLRQVREQKNELENQQEELRQSNDELTRQAEVLQQSEQELRIQEEELRQINAELMAQNNAVELARTELAEKAQELEVSSKYKSEFLANMSHELRTPLNSVLILAKLLAENKQRNLSEKQIEYANIIHKSGADLLELINDILDLSKIEAGKIELLFGQASITGIVDDMTQLFSVVADEKGVALSTRISSDVPVMIWTDKQRLEQIIKNLLSNAFKFTPKGGSVTLAVNRTDRRTVSPDMVPSARQSVLAISVTDTGIGISSEKQQIIFEAFQQADGSINRKFGGTGLGLSISKELIRKLGGELDLQSEPGNGSTFTIYLPLVDPPEAEYAQPTNNSPGNTVIRASEPAKVMSPPDDDRHNLAPGDKVLLIIEDDPAFAGIIRDFAREKSFKVLIALQGDEGIEYARRYTPSAIILDMGLPIVNGRDVLNTLKSEETLKHIPVHIISAMDEPMAADKDILAYTTKPVDKKDLDNVLAAITTYLGAEKAMAVPDSHPDKEVSTHLPNGQASNTVSTAVPVLTPAAGDEAIQGKKVLLVDDDMRNVFALSTLLEANQMTVITAADGREALDQLKEHPDTAIVLMDIMMPEMDGYEATRRIRADKRLTALPVIALTAKAMASDREKCLEAGASDYITKPVDSTLLFSIMRRWLAARQ